MSGDMTSALNLARLAAVVAIFGFFLPWAEVSCSGQPLAHETGIQLITGGAGTAAPGHHDLWVAAAFGFVILGLAGGLIARGRRAAVILTAAALAAAAASLIELASQEVPSAGVQAQLIAGPSGGDASARQAASELIRARLEYGVLRHPRRPDHRHRRRRPRARRVSGHRAANPGNQQRSALRSSNLRGPSGPHPRIDNLTQQSLRPLGSAAARSSLFRAPAVGADHHELVALECPGAAPVTAAAVDRHVVGPNARAEAWGRETRNLSEP